MPATAADIAAATRDAVTATWESATIKTRYPTLARDGSDTAIGGCDAIADAQSLVNAQGALIGVERKRFKVAVEGLQWLDPSSGIPCVTLIDSEFGTSAVYIVARMIIDLEEEITFLELFG